MNIGFLTSEYPHNITGSSGGIGTSIKNLANAFTELNHQVTVYVIDRQLITNFLMVRLK